MKKLIFVVLVVLILCAKASAVLIIDDFGLINTQFSTSGGGDALLLESGDYFLLETGDKLLLE